MSRFRSELNCVVTAILVASWILFALLWWSLAVWDSPPSNGTSFSENATTDDAARNPCVVGVHDFLTALLFSIETQQTIGYGNRSLGSPCWFSTSLLMVQSCIGFLLQILIVGLTYTKLMRPSSSAKTVIFSRRAVVCLRDGVHCLLFRVGNMQRSHIVNVSIKALLVYWERSPAGSSLNQRQLNLETDTGETFWLLAWPLTVVHRITASSPLWALSADQFKNSPREIIVVLQVYSLKFIYLL
jgi:potassium inwardly-rectifying channel subfamily J